MFLWLMIWLSYVFHIFFTPLDDRFILKQMKKAEVESFVEIADGYFNHLRKAFDQNVIFTNCSRYSQSLLSTAVNIVISNHYYSRFLKSAVTNIAS